MKIVITGTTGQIGRHLTSFLNYSDHEVVLISRDANKLSADRARGATVREGNMLDGAFMLSSLADADVFFFLPPPNFSSENMVEEYRQLATVARDAARASGVPRVVHLSTLGAQVNSPETGLAYGQHLAEVIIRDAAPHVLSLRNGFFLENYQMAVGSIAQSGDIFFPVTGATKYAFVATDDIAAIVRDLLEFPTWTGRSVIEFQGPRDYSFDEVAAQIGAGVGREVRHVAVPSEAAVGAMIGMGIGPAYARDLVQLFAAIQSGVLKAEYSRNDPRVKSTGRTPREFAERVLRPMTGKA